VPVAGDGAAPPLPARRRRMPRRLHPGAAERGTGVASGGRPGARRAALGVLDRHVHVPVRRGARRRGAGSRQHVFARRRACSGLMMCIICHELMWTISMKI
jgi:hypothetical protein